MAVFWDVDLCSLVEVYWRFRGTYCLDHQGHHYFLVLLFFWIFISSHFESLCATMVYLRMLVIKGTAWKYKAQVLWTLVLQSIFSSTIPVSLGAKGLTLSWKWKAKEILGHGTNSVTCHNVFELMSILFYNIFYNHKINIVHTYNIYMISFWENVSLKKSFYKNCISLHGVTNQFAVNINVIFFTAQICTQLC
jgi:hypothetical protein